jgi:hypothetical protein
MAPHTWIDLIGIWTATLLTLSVYSFLVKDNFFYKLTEAIFVGVSVGYSIVVVYHNGIVPKIQKPLTQYVRNLNVDKTPVTNTVAQTTFTTLSALALKPPSEDASPFSTNGFYSLLENTLSRSSINLNNTNEIALAVQKALENSNYTLTNSPLIMSVTDQFLSSYSVVNTKKHLWVAYIIFSMCLGLLFLSRFSPSHAWVSRFPMAYLLGIGVGIGIPLDFQTRILEQLKATIMPVVYNVNGKTNWMITFGNITLLIGILSVLYYFFFSLKKKDTLSKGLTHVGIAYLMIGFGASFAFTIMARVSLLIGRVDFLYEEAYKGTLAFFGF